MKEILLFGDSWPCGSELKPSDLTFGDIISHRLGIPLKIYARCSTSIPHLILQFQQARDNQTDLSGCLALFFLTSTDRDLIWSADRDKELHLNPNHPDDVDIRWYSQWHTNHLAIYRVNTTIMALQAMCRYHGVSDRYVWGWNKVDLWPEIDRTKFYGSGNITTLDFFDDVDAQGSLTTYINTVPNCYVYPNQSHPNPAGHEKIASTILPWLIDSI
jgi:hypothetical protein